MSVYHNLYNLLNMYIYGGSILPGSFEELTAVLLSTLGALFLVALPFALVLKFIIRWI